MPRLNKVLMSDPGAPEPDWSGLRFYFLVFSLSSSLLCLHSHFFFHHAGGYRGALKFPKVLMHRIFDIPIRPPYLNYSRGAQASCSYALNPLMWGVLINLSFGSLF